MQSGGEWTHEWIIQSQGKKYKVVGSGPMSGLYNLKVTNAK